jgi:hypothetical protein
LSVIGLIVTKSFMFTSLFFFVAIFLLNYY